MRYIGFVIHFVSDLFIYFCIDSDLMVFFFVLTKILIFVLTGMAWGFILLVILLFLCWQVYPWSLLACQWEPLDWRDMETTNCEYICSQNSFALWDLFHKIKLYRARCIMHNIQRIYYRWLIAGEVFYELYLITLMISPKKDSVFATCTVINTRYLSVVAVGWPLRKVWYMLL